MSVGAGRARVLRQLAYRECRAVGGRWSGWSSARERANPGIVFAHVPDFYVPNEVRIEVNSYVLAFSAGISVLTGILFRLVPALECSLTAAGGDAEGRDQGCWQQRGGQAAAEYPGHRGGHLAVVLLMGPA